MLTGVPQIIYPSARSIFLRQSTVPRTAAARSNQASSAWVTGARRPDLNFIYVHCNRVISKYDLNMIYIAGPGHGGPGMVANTYLEGTYSEIYPHIAQDRKGMKRLFTQFSFPGGIPSHVAPETPGSIHEGGELGYSLVHAYGAVFDNPESDGLLCHRRRRSGDRSARDELALEQVSESRARRRRAARFCI